jgi:hypothetical protein
MNSILNKNDLIFFKQKLTNKRVKKVVNVYQQKYINGNADGFGDYLRGCISLSLLCHLLNLDFGMNIKNHLIHHFINTTNHVDTNIHYDTIKKVSIAGKYSNKNDVDDIISEINKTQDEICYLYTTLFFEPTLLYNDANTLYIKKVIINILPNNRLNDTINEYIIKNNLNKINYDIIHIRGGDDLLLNNPANKPFIDMFILYISKKLKKHINRNKLFIIIGDNAYCKLCINSIYPNTIIIRNISPVHLGMGNTDMSNVMGTMIEFYLMAKASQVISFSRYSHGSGFSKWASFLFNKPHIQYIYTEVNNNFNNIIQ